MGDRRKLQGEIERCLKKVTEGVETFEDIWQKVHSAPNHNQKDKYEQELKKEIKKLQRLRDQIKAWISSTEIKDKKSLQEARKNIEQQMERFKVVERETKTKAYSKEGLGAGQKIDPQEKEKEECNQWITEAIQEMRIQIDKFESDIESLSVCLKKKKSDKDKQERLEETKHSIERHKFHIESLEKILRAINNDALDLKTIHNLRADIEYYIESNQDSDFKENEHMYEEIDMDNLSTLMAPVIVAPPQSHLPLLNGSSSLSSSGATALMDVNAPLMSINTSSMISGERAMAASSLSATNSYLGDGESAMALTSPSSTQPSSPSASPALSTSDDRRRNKSESEDYQSHRHRSNSGALASSASSTANNTSSTANTSTTSGSHMGMTATSPKNPMLQQQQQHQHHHQQHSSSGVSPSAPSSSKPITPSAPSSASILSTSAPPHFTYPISSASAATTLPIIQYSTIVSQNTAPLTSTTTTSSSNTSSSTTGKQQQQVLSPSSNKQTKQTSMSNGTGTTTNNNDSTVITTSSLPMSSMTTTITNSSNSSHPPSLLSTQTSLSNDRTGLLNQHILNNISQISAPMSSSSSTPSTITLASGATIPSSLYTGPGSTLSSSNIPLDLSSSSSSNDPGACLTPSIIGQSQQSSLLGRTISDADRGTSSRLLDSSSTGGQSSMMSNGSSDSHSLLDNPFAPSSSGVSSSFLTNNNNNIIGDVSTSNGVLGQLASAIPINPDSNALRYLLPSSSSNVLHQQQQQTGNNNVMPGRVPLTQAEMRMLHRLNSAYAKLPSLLESERQRTMSNRIYPRNPLGHSQTVPYYPQVPPSGSDTADFYYRLAPDTLFFVFYYMEGTRAQYLAAKALKRQSWRFHTKHMMWFQRHEEPKTITDDYEQGTYIYFDFERWQTRKRDNFIFEYKFLEDREF